MAARQDKCERRRYVKCGERTCGGVVRRGGTRGSREGRAKRVNTKTKAANGMCSLQTDTGVLVAEPLAIALV